MASRVIPLSTAAGLVLVRVDPDHDPRHPRSADARNIAAVALSALIPIYKRDREDALQRMTEEELAAGSFVEGASRFAFRDGRAAVQQLAVKESDAEKAVETITASFLGLHGAKRPTLTRPRSPS